MALAAPSSLSRAATTDLLKLHASIHRELRTRNIARTANSPVGDYAEWLAKGALRLELAGNSSAGYDAIDQRTKAKYEVKAIRRNHLGKAPQFSALRNLKDARFDFLVAVVFSEDYVVERAVVLPHASVVGAVGTFRKHTNSHPLFNDKRLWEAPSAKDVTKKFQAEQAKAGG